METIRLVQGDTAPDLYVTIGDRNTDTSVSITGSTSILRFRKKGTTTVLQTITGSLPNGGTDGLVKFVWPSGALANDGYYEGEIEITFSNSEIQTVYELLQFEIRKQF